MTDDTLRQYIEAIETLNAEVAETRNLIREKFAEAKATGYDTKAMRQVIRLRAMDPDARAEIEAITEMYMNVLEN